jgi:putative ABC transport system substrate-binding protein
MVQAADPVELGLVTSLAKPGGNMTGFGNYELSIGGKWLEVLREIAPNTNRVGVIVDPTNPSWRAYLHAVEIAAPLFKMEMIQTNVRTASDIKGAIDDLGRKPNTGLIPLPAPIALRHHELIVALAARHGIPAVYPYRYFAQAGGLMSYGVDLIDMYRQSATYVDRILKGEKPADLPVQAPTKLELVINLKTAKALGLDIPPTLLARADEVIE